MTIPEPTEPCPNRIAALGPSQIKFKEIVDPVAKLADQIVEHFNIYLRAQNYEQHIERVGRYLTLNIYLTSAEWETFRNVSINIAFQIEQTFIKAGWNNATLLVRTDPERVREDRLELHLWVKHPVAHRGPET